MNDKIFKETFFALLLCELGALLEHSDKGFFFIITIHTIFTYLIVYKKEKFLLKLF